MSSKIGLGVMVLEAFDFHGSRLAEYSQDSVGYLPTSREVAQDLVWAPELQGAGDRV